MEVLSGFLWESLDFGAWYAAHAWVIDGLIYLVFFLGIVRVTIGVRFQGEHNRGGAAVTASFGVALAIAATVTGRETGFMLSELGPLAWGILLSVLALAGYDLLRRFSVPRFPAAGAALVLIALTASTVGRPFESLLLAFGLAAWVTAGGAVGIMMIAAWVITRGLGTGRHGSGPHAPHEYPAEPIDEDGPDAAHTWTTAELISALRGYLDDHPLDKHSEGLLLAIVRRQRSIDRSYEAALRAFARSGHIGEQSPRSLSDGAQEVLAACRRNSARFRETLRVAEAGHHARNKGLVLEALARLQKLERHADRLEKALRAILSQHTQSGRAP